jgi:hypothetical protein
MAGNDRSFLLDGDVAAASPVGEYSSSWIIITTMAQIGEIIQL